MTYEPVSMTMPSLDCPTPYPKQPQRTFVLDRLKQRFGQYGRHNQNCMDRYSAAQQTIRANEKLETNRLWQRAQDNAKNKKGTKTRMDISRQKAPPIDPSDHDNGYPGLSLARVGPSLKRKMPMGGGESLECPGYGDGNSQQEPKKMKNDQQNITNNQRQEYPLPSVSVQIVQNFNGEPANQIETTVNVHSNRNMPDSQSVRVNVDSKNIKQETDGRHGQPQQQQQMHQQNMNQCPSGNSEPADLGGLLEGDFIPGAEDIDMNMLHDLLNQMPEVMEGLDRDMMTPDTQRQMPPQPQQMPSQPQQMPPQPQQMPPQPQQMPSQPQQMPSQSPQMTTMQSHHHMMSQSHHPMTSQPPQMVSPPHNHMTSQSPQMTSQSHHPVPLQSPRVMSQSHQYMPSQSPRTGPQQIHHHNMTSQSPQMTSQYPQQQHHMASHPQHMTSPLRHMTSPPIQHVPQAARMVCKREKVDMYHGFRGNTPENKPEPQGLPRQNSHGMTQQNISANIVTRQSVQMSGAGNFSANLSAQQNISVNMMQQNNFPASHRVMQTNNNNMTSQHIHRLNQVAQFGSREPSPPEATRIYHPPANTHVSAQPGYYESHSQHLKQLAEKRSYGANPGSVPMNMNPDPRSSQHYPPHYRTEAAPAMSQPVNIQSHHHHPNMAPSGGQRVPHMDAAVYSRSSQYVQAQRPVPGMNMMMQQSEAMVMKQYQMQPNQHAAYYNRVPDPHPQQVVASNPNPGYPPGTVPHSSWNTRAGQWPPSSHNPVHRGHMNPDHRSYMTSDQRTQVTLEHMRPQMTSDQRTQVTLEHMRPQMTSDQRTQVTLEHMRPQMTSDHRTQVTLEHMRPQMNSEIAPPNYLPELDSELNFIDEILSKNNA